MNCIFWRRKSVFCRRSSVPPKSHLCVPCSEASLRIVAGKKTVDFSDFLTALRNTAVKSTRVFNVKTSDQECVVFSSSSGLRNMFQNGHIFVISVKTKRKRNRKKSEGGGIENSNEREAKNCKNDKDTEAKNNKK